MCIYTVHTQFKWSGVFSPRSLSRRFCLRPSEGWSLLWRRPRLWWRKGSWSDWRTRKVRSADLFSTWTIFFLLWVSVLTEARGYRLTLITDVLVWLVGVLAAARVTQLVRGFSCTWKQSVESMSQDVMRSFTNFKNGTSIIQVRTADDCEKFSLFTKGNHVSVGRVAAGGKGITHRPVRCPLYSSGTNTSWRPVLLLFIPQTLQFTVDSHVASLPAPAAGRSHAAHPVLPRLPQGPEPADVPQPRRPLGAHQPAPPHGGGEEAQTQLLTERH